MHFTECIDLCLHFLWPKGACAPDELFLATALNRYEAFHTERNEGRAAALAPASVAYFKHGSDHAVTFPSWEGPVAIEVDVNGSCREGRTSLALAIQEEHCKAEQTPWNRRAWLLRKVGKLDQRSSRLLCKWLHKMWDML
jgi:hypothetical protein